MQQMRPKISRARNHNPTARDSQLIYRRKHKQKALADGRKLPKKPKIHDNVPLLAAQHFVLHEQNRNPFRDRTEESRQYEKAWKQLEDGLFEYHLPLKPGRLFST